MNPHSNLGFGGTFFFLLFKCADVAAQQVKAALWDRRHVQPDALQPPSVWPATRTARTSVTPERRSVAARELAELGDPPVVDSSYFICFLRGWSAAARSCKLSSHQWRRCLTAPGTLPRCTVGQQRCGSRPWPRRHFPALESTFAEKSAAVKPERLHAAAWESANSLWVDF